MKLIKTTEAVGHILCHDMTQIIKDKYKDARFRKGHIVTEEDIPILLSMGKENLYVWENDETIMHENDAAQVLYEICQNSYMESSQVKEGKIELKALIDGLLVIDINLLDEINSLGEIIIASRKNFYPLKKGDKVAGMRVIPLVIKKEKMELAKKIASGKQLFKIIPFIPKKAALVTTGSEVFSGLIKDTFSPVVIEKLKEYGAEIIGQKLVGDNPENITSAINEFIKDGADLVVCTGGMSVDPDDRTPLGIKNTGAEIVSYGAPVLPGAMFMLAYDKNDIPIMGLPGCVMYAGRTIFDKVLPRIMADVKVSKEDIQKMGNGGLCLGCDVCTFPNCGFGC